MSPSTRTVHIIAGPNGAGKSTFVENYLSRYIDCDEFLNADLIAKGLSPFAPERQARKASEIFLERLNELEQAQFSFALETTLAGLSYRRRVERWKKLGFEVTLYFIWLPNAEMATERVANRVAQGGHNIPQADIERRYNRGLRNFNTFYLQLVDHAWVLNGSVIPPEIIWRRFDGEESILNADLWHRVRMHSESGK